MTAALQPSWRFTLKLAKYPASAGTTTYRWSTRPFADAGAWSEGRLVSISPIERACSDQDGNYELSSVRVVVMDDDALIRGLLSGSTTRFWSNREAFIEILSEAGRAAGSAWRTVFRGVVGSVALKKGRRIEIELTDLVGSAMSGFNLDKTIGVPITKADHPDMRDQDDGQFIYSIIAGEVSDIGALAADGITSAEKGLIPLRYLGEYDISGSTEPPSYGAPPTIASASVVGGAGTATYYYAAILVTPYGWSQIGDVVTVTNAPSVRTGSNYIALSIPTFDPGDPSNLNRVVIAGRSSNPPATFLDEANYIDQAAGIAYYNDNDDNDVEKGFPVTLGPALQSDTVWSRFSVGIGAIENVLRLEWSDLADGTTPKRVPADPALDGVEYLTPQSAAWPHPDKFLVTASGIQYTPVYLRGLRAKHAIDGTVTAAVNVCGAEDVGDASGTMMDEAFKVGQWFFNEHVLKNGGTGYRSGNWGPLETYTNGDEQLQTSEWAAAQALTVDRIGGRGYLAAFALCEAITVREFVRRFCLSFDCRLAVNHHGQIFPVLIDDMADSTAGRAYRDRIEIKELGDQTVAYDELENRITYSYDWDADAQIYRVQGQITEDVDSIAANVPGAVAGDSDRRGALEGQPQELFCVRDATTARDSRARRLTRNKRVPRYVPKTTDLMGLEDDLGSQTRDTHYDGLPDTNVPFLTLRHAVDPMTNEVILTGLDLGAIALADSTVMTATGFVMTDSGPEMR